MKKIRKIEAGTYTEVQAIGTLVQKVNEIIDFINQGGKLYTQSELEEKIKEERERVAKELDNSIQIEYKWPMRRVSL